MHFDKIFSNIQLNPLCEALAGQQHISCPFIPGHSLLSSCAECHLLLFAKSTNYLNMSSSVQSQSLVCQSSLVTERSRYWCWCLLKSLCAVHCNGASSLLNMKNCSHIHEAVFTGSFTHFKKLTLWKTCLNLQN